MPTGSTVYSAMLDLLDLRPDHHADLARRGLSESENSRIGFASAPTGADIARITSRLASDHDLTCVPGFYLAGASWRMVDYGDRYFVPYRDPLGRIRGLQMKLVGGKYIWFSSSGQPGGASSGAPVHFARPELIADEVLLTEGALKASVISYLTNTPVIAAAGVTQCGENFAAHLRRRFPDLRRIVIAYDCDLVSNDQVYRALERLASQLVRERFAVRYRTWDIRFKGYDDFLAAHVAGREAVAA